MSNIPKMGHLPTPAKAIDLFQTEKTMAFPNTGTSGSSSRCLEIKASLPAVPAEVIYPTSLKPWGFIADLSNNADLPSGYVKIAIENDH